MLLIVIYNIIHSEFFTLKKGEWWIIHNDGRIGQKLTTCAEKIFNLQR